VSANLQACSFLLGRLDREVAKLKALTFPGHHTGPRKWLSFIAGILDTAKSYLAQAETQGFPAAESERLVREAERLGDNAYQLLTFVAGTDATQIPHQVVAPFQRWVEALGIKETIFFRAEHLPNYELAWIDLRHYGLINGATKSLQDATLAIDWPALRVSVPGHAMGLLPHFAVVGHELGHAIQDQVKVDLTPFTQGIGDAITRAMARLNADGVTWAHEHSIRTGEILKAWLNELKSDAVGHYLVGPAFFFALCGFLELSGRGSGMSGSHPPSDLRRELLFQKLNEGTPSFAAILATKTGLLITEDFNSPNIARRLPDTQMYEELRDRIGKVDAAVTVELTSAIAAIAPTIFHAAQVHLQATSPDLVYTPTQLSADLDRHLDLLCHLVPPVEFMNAGQLRPATLSTIINVGWTALLTKVDQFPTIRGFGGSPPIAARMESLHELLLKAVELAEARQLWEELA